MFGISPAFGPTRRPIQQPPMGLRAFAAPTRPPGPPATPPPPAGMSQLSGLQRGGMMGPGAPPPGGPPPNKSTEIDGQGQIDPLYAAWMQSRNRGRRY